MPVGEHENDTAVLMRALSQCNSGAEITQLLAGVQGPFAFVFWQVCSGAVSMLVCWSRSLATLAQCRAHERWD